MVSPGLLQKAYGARSERAVRVGIGVNGLALLAFAFVPAMLGMAARVLHPGLENSELALPTLMVADLPAWVGALALAAVFSAEISAADAVLFMLSTSLSQDLYRRFLRPEADDAQVLRVARGAAIAGGALGVLLAIVTPGIIDSLTLFYSLLGVSLFVPVVAGLHRRRAGVPEALASIAAGVTVATVLRLSGLTPAWLISPELTGMLAAAVAYGAVLAVTRRRLARASAGTS
jgi:SSS family solute:Na+ symporter